MATTEERVTNLEEHFTKVVKRWRLYRQQHQEGHQRFTASWRARFDELEAWMSEMDKREAEQDAVLDEIIEAMEQGR